MWHEARAQEKRLRGFMVDQHKRADRRRKYYEKVVGMILGYEKIPKEHIP